MSLCPMGGTSAAALTVVATIRHTIARSPIPVCRTFPIATLSFHHNLWTSNRAMSSSASFPSATDQTKVMKEKTKCQEYGTWESPISAKVVAESTKHVDGFAVDGEGRLVWVETRPEEGGRAVLVKEAEDEGNKPTDITPSGFAVRTLAQEYGGIAFSVLGNMVIFSNYQDQRLYKQIIGDGVPVPITRDYGNCKVRYADGVVDSNLNRYITIMEDHLESSQNPKATIASIDILDDNMQEPKLPEVLVSGSDFYAFPRIDPSGKKMAWIEWNHPNMPWDRAELWIGYFSTDGKLQSRVCVAGGDAAVVESPTEPKWSPKGELFFITDRKTGFWNIYKWIESENTVEPVYSLNAEFTRPLWVFGMSSYDFILNEMNNTLVACSFRQGGKSYFGILDCSQGSFSPVDIHLPEVYDIVSGNQCVYVECASAVHPVSITKLTLGDDESKDMAFSLIWSSCLDTEKYLPYISLPEIIEFPTEVPGENAYAYFYPPTNPAYQSLMDDKPPLLLKCHGGPTGESRGVLDMSVQYWTSRGWAFVDVNYGGSTGYGRDYRERLLGRWGITDVNDCCGCAKFLVESGRVDGNKLCITGKSAGGYTALASLAFRNTFKAGASLYGIGDLSLLRAEMHKFESRYLDNLIGSDRDYFERSPFNYVDNFTCPVILFQGLEDKVVPPDQARKLYKTLKERGVPVALVEFEGERHGFKKAENIIFTMEQQMLFFARVVGKFKVHDDITPVKIDNFD